MTHVEGTVLQAFLSALSFGSNPAERAKELKKKRGKGKRELDEKSPSLGCFTSQRDASSNHVANTGMIA